ncbi:MAG: NmrA family NAD(P)-binding protein [Thermomicrobiales bacterium]
MTTFDLSYPVLVYLANGVQGSAAVRAALRHGLTVRALVQDRAHVTSQYGPGVELVEGSLDDPASLRSASHGVRHAIVQVPIGSPDATRSRAAHALAAAEGLSSFVLRLASASRPAPCEEPGFVASHAIEVAARQTGIPFATVRPTMYLDNLLKPSAREEIVHDGVFAPPIPVSQRIAWTSVDDCAEAAITLLVRGAMGGDHCIAGPESLTGDELAERLSAGFGHPIVYRGQSLAEFERDIDAAAGAGMGRRVSSKFRYFADHPDEADRILATAYVATPELAGFVPTSATAWARAHRDAFGFAE